MRLVNNNGQLVPAPKFNVGDIVESNGKYPPPGAELGYEPLNPGQLFLIIGAHERNHSVYDLRKLDVNMKPKPGAIGTTEAHECELYLVSRAKHLGDTPLGQLLKTKYGKV